MTLCQMCRAIPDNFIEAFSKPGWRQFYIHHPSYVSLELSARSGCNVCLFIYNAFGDFNKWEVDWKKWVVEYPCEREQWDGFAFEAVRVGPPENVASSDGRLPMFCVLSAEEEFRLAYKLGKRGVCLFFSIVKTGSLNPFGLLPLHQINFELASRWINQCAESHGCSVTYDVIFSPTRLIEVGHMGQSPHLVESKDNNLQNCKYVALSHCWGTSMPRSAITTSSTRSRRLAKITLKTLPRTYRDAIIATRKLGIKYLWIDSLCIMQDSSADWQHESALMGKVYSHCYCMLAAVTSKSCHGGLFPLRDELPILHKNNDSLLLKPFVDEFDPQKLLLNSPLSLRGWTLQEWELAPKVLYFTKNEMFFGCREGYGHRKLPDSYYYNKNHREEILIDQILSKSGPLTRCLDSVISRSNKLGPSDFQLNLELRHDAWRIMVSGYSRRHLTVPTDRFPALSGLASEYAFILDDQYVAGLWRNDLIRGLCWRSAIEPVPEWQVEYYGPSWSWAKVGGAISYDLLDNHSSPTSPSGLGEPTICKVDIVQQGSDPNGTLISAYIHLHGQLFPLRQVKSVYKLNDVSLNTCWDFLPRKHISYSLLSLGSSLLGIVLEEFLPTMSNEKLKHYRRVGIASLRGVKFGRVEERAVTEMILV